MPQECLNGADVVTFLEQARGEAVTKSMGLYRFLNVGFCHGCLEVFAQCGVVKMMAAKDA